MNKNLGGCLKVPSIWDMGKSETEKLADEWKEKGELQDKIDKHRGKFEDKFRANMKKDVPVHPYKLYREIVENKDLSESEKVVLEQIKDEFSEKWQDLKSIHGPVEGSAKEIFEDSNNEKIPDRDLHDLMNGIVEQIVSMEAFLPYCNSPKDEAIEGKFNFVPEDNEIIAERYFEFLDNLEN